MKKIVFFIITAFMLQLSCLVYGKTGLSVISTDIVTFINHQPIESYSIQNGAYIALKDLEGYGFSLVPNSANNSINITRSNLWEQAFVPVEKINAKKPVAGKKLYDVYTSDVNVYAGNDLISSYKVNDKIVISIHDLYMFGYCNYDGKKRQINLDIMRYELDDAFDKAKKEIIQLEEGVTYNGEVKNGKPNGIGKKIRDTSLMKNPSENSYFTEFGYFKDGKLHGAAITEGFIQPLRGSYTQKYSVLDYSYYKDGAKDGFSFHFSDKYYSPYRTDFNYSMNQRNGFSRESQYDDSYVFGFKVNFQSNYEYDALIDYDKSEFCDLKFSKVTSMMGYSAASLISENGLMFSIGYDSQSNRRVATYHRFNAMDGDWIQNWVLARDNKLYRVIDENEKNDVWIAKDVVYATEMNYIDKNGVLWEDAEDGKGYYKVMDDVKKISGGLEHLILKKDGTVWIRRGNRMGHGFVDGVKLPEAVKVTDNAKYISYEAKRGAFIIKEDNSLWEATFEFSSGYQKNPTIELRKIGDGFVKAFANGASLAMKGDNTLWGWGDNTFGQLLDTTKKNIPQPVKLMEDVIDFVVAGDSVLVIKKDGTLWTWGRDITKPVEYNVDVEGVSIKAPVQIKDFYKIVQTSY